MRKLRFIALTFSLSVSALLYPHLLFAQVTVVVDAQHNGTSTIEATAEGANLALKQFFENPAWERISKVQEFIKDASIIISTVIKNLKITRELIEVETDIIQLFNRTSQLIDQSENLPRKWLYQKVLIELWAEKLRIFEVFDIATEDNKGILDDEGRIQLIRDSLLKAKQIRTSMRLIIRRANKDIFLARSTEREIAAFTALFE